MAQALAKIPPGQLIIKAGATFGDEHVYANEIAQILRKAGWGVRVDNALFTGPDVSGAWLSVPGAGGMPVPPTVIQLAEALLAGGVLLRPSAEALTGMPPDEVWLSIGAKK